MSRLNDNDALIENKIFILCGYDGMDTYPIAVSRSRDKIERYLEENENLQYEYGLHWFFIRSLDDD